MGGGRPSPRPSQRLTLLQGESEASTEAREDGGVRAGETGQDAEEHLVRKAADAIFAPPAEHRAQHRGVTDDGKAEGRVRREFAHRVESGDARNHQHRPRAGVARGVRPGDDEMRGAQTKARDASPPRLRVRAPPPPRTRARARRRASRAVREPVVVLDDVDAFLGELVRRRASPRWSSIGFSAVMIIGSRERRRVDEDPRRQT